MRYHTCQEIKTLPKNWVFVFWSNEAWRHWKWAALTAKQYFWAQYGVWNGLTWESYAIPTKDAKIASLWLNSIDKYIEEFSLFVKNNPDKNFLVTKVGCWLAWNSEKEIAELFSKHLSDIWNIVLPIEFETFMPEEWTKVKVQFKDKGSNRLKTGMN